MFKGLTSIGKAAVSVTAKTVGAAATVTQTGGEVVRDASAVVSYFVRDADKVFGGSNEETASSSTSRSDPEPPPEPFVRERVVVVSTNMDYPEDTRVCEICFTSFQDINTGGDQIMSTPCGHVFCRNCITRALEESRHCPHCRADVDESGLRRIFI